MVIESVFTTVGSGLVTRMGPDTPLVQLSLFLVIAGLGLGLSMQQPYTTMTLVLE